MIEEKRRGDNPYSIKQDSGRGITIGQLVDSVSRLTGQRCTPAMIYNYEKKGLLPTPTRTQGGFRLYRTQDIHQVVCIKHFQSQGLSLEEILERIGTCEEELDLTSQELDLPLDRRIQILEAAARIFPRKGYASTTLQDIAQDAGISVSAIYQHYRGKEDLFIALTENLSFIPILDEINITLNEENDINYEDIRRSLVEAGEGFLTTHIRNMEILRMFLIEPGNFPEVGKRYYAQLVVPIEQLLERYLSVQMERGVLRKVNALMAVQGFYGIFLNIVITEYLLAGKDRNQPPSRDRVQQYVDNYLLGLFH